MCLYFYVRRRKKLLIDVKAALAETKIFKLWNIKLEYCRYRIIKVSCTILLLSIARAIYYSFFFTARYSCTVATRAPVYNVERATSDSTAFEFRARIRSASYDPSYSPARPVLI